MFDPAGSNVWGLLLRSELRTQPSTTDPLPQESTWRCWAGTSLPSETQAERPVFPGGGREVGRKGGWVPSPVFPSALTHPSKTVSSLQMPLLTALRVCQAETLVFGRKRGSFH